MKMMLMSPCSLLLLIALFQNFLGATNAFQPARHQGGKVQSGFLSPWLHYSSPSDVEDDFESLSQTILEPTDSSMKSTTTTSSGGMVLDCVLPDENVALKSQLLRLAASYDRGFGASASARQQAEAVICDLEQCPNAASNAASTILNDHNNSNKNSSPSLIGTWRLIWTTALDVLSLQASPFFMAGAIHQVFERSSSNSSSDKQGGVVTNVIDFEPRVEMLFPGNSKSMIRARVTTRACEPVLAVRHPNRVGLVFETVTLQPQKFWGLDSSRLPPLTLNLPRLPDSMTAAGYFDVTYLDPELLIIRQNAPGGLFALLRVDSLDAP